MKHSIPFKFKQAPTKNGEGKKYSAIASTDALDRDREVLLPKGCIIEEFLKNPVMLHIHDYHHVPVGKVSDIRIDEKQVTFDFEFADTELGKQIEEMYIKGYMNAFSVGFYPLQSKWIDEDTPDEIELDVADGSKQTFDVASYKLRPRRVINQWELLEISPVPVPSNPEALLLRAKENVVRKFMSVEGHSAAQGQLLEERINETMKSTTAHLKTFLDSLSGDDDLNITKSIPYAQTPIEKEAAWDDTGSRAKLAKWASEDGTGDKEKINWGLYAKGFAWVNVDKASTFSAYKFPHHSVTEENELIAVESGVRAAMAELLSGKELDLDSDEAKDVYAHLASHYQDAEKQAPEFSKDYTEEDLKQIEDGTYVAKTEESEESKTSEETSATEETGSPEDSDDLVALIRSVLREELASIVKSLEDNLVELDETVRLRMNILLDAVEDVQKSLTKKEPDKEQVTSEPEEDEDDKSFSKSLTQMQELLKDLSGAE